MKGYSSPWKYALALVRHLPGAFNGALGRLTNGLLTVAGVVVLFNRPLASSLAAWHGFSPLFAVVPFAALLLIDMGATAYRLQLPLVSRADSAERQLAALQARLDAASTETTEARTRAAIEGEIALGRRAVSGAKDAISYYHAARQQANDLRLLAGGERNPLDVNDPQSRALVDFQRALEPWWLELLIDLRDHGVIDDVERYRAKVNMTGFSEFASEISAYGAQLLRQYDVDPTEVIGTTDLHKPIL